MNRERGNIFLAGVGGQGIILASEVLCDAFLLAGYSKRSKTTGRTSPTL